MSYGYLTALDALVLALLGASQRTAQHFKPNIDEHFPEEPSKALAMLCTLQGSFLGFFLHLAMRSAFSLLGATKRDQLQDLLVPLLADLHTEGAAGHWPKKLQNRLFDDIIDSFNEAEVDYGQCKGELLVKDRLFSRDGLISRLSFNVAEQLGEAYNAETMLQCTIVVRLELIRIDLPELIARIDREGFASALMPNRPWTLE